MPTRCIVGGCSNTNQDGVSLHLFPKESNLRKLWTSRVKLTRGNWNGPSDSSVVCSAHFEEGDFDDGLFASFNMKRLRRLKPQSVPKIRSMTSTSSTTASTDAKRSAPVRTASEKRKRMRVIDEILATTSQELQVAGDAELSTEELSLEAAPADDSDESGPSHQVDENPCQTITGPSGHVLEQVEEQVMEVQQQGLRRSVGTQVSVATRVKRTQKSIQMSDKGAQIQPDPPVSISRGTTYDIADTGDREQEVEPIEEDGDASPESDHPKEPSSPGYQPDSSSSTSSSDKHLKETPPKKSRKRLSKRKRGQSPRTQWEAQGSDVTPHEERKYIIFESKLMELLNICPSCHSGNVTLYKREVGTLLVVTRECASCLEKATTWESQPWIGGVAAGNILLSASILFAGGSSTETLRILDHMGVAAFSERTFYRHQDQILAPAIGNQWELSQEALLADLLDKGDPLTIGGDGRADSPGHTAKYGVYTAIELNANKIVDFKLVQCNEVESSYHMELEGYKRVTTYLTGKGLVIHKVITDRHRQLAKHIRESSPDVVHLFDVWHVAKSIRKKVHALAKQKDCECLLEWEQSINNHVYWVAASCGDDEPDLREAKWKSLMNHIQGIHQGHSEIFPRCLHQDLEAQGRTKKWLKPGTKVCEKLDDILTRTMLVNDVKKLSGGKQTSSLEAYHSKINHYAPKLKAYSYIGMTCRLQLAAMDYNENSDRKQATTAKGDKCYKVSKLKFKPGKATVKALKEAKTFSFVDGLMTDIARHSANYRDYLSKRKAAPPSMASQHTYPAKEELIQQHRSRFNQQ